MNLDVLWLVNAWFLFLFIYDETGAVSFCQRCYEHKHKVHRYFYHLIVFLTNVILIE